MGVEVWVVSPRPACGERSKPQASGEGDCRRVRLRGDSPSPQPSPRKRAREKWSAARSRRCVAPCVVPAKAGTHNHRA
jgi:hypothetical protein